LLLLAGASMPAQAFTTFATASSTSLVGGAYTIDFGVSAVNNSAPASGALPNGVQGGVGYSYTGGALFNFDSSSSLPNGTSARPPGSTGNFWSIGTSPAAQQGPGVVSFSSGVSYFGFLWGSPDAYNTVSFFDGDNLLGSFTGAAILIPPNGDQSYSRYFNAFAGAGELITRVTFSSGQNAFETDNHAFATPVPEPETYAMMLAGLGLLAFTRTRRRRAKAA
jgi:hypothetical protein